uniref:Uncharacterized protein n=1 Tax=Romanomermis culicivorax TaxID=13658 RepID=A0A915L6N0_ROMCU
MRTKTKQKEKTNITVQKLGINGGDGGEYRRQIEIVVDCRDGCDFLGDSGRCDNHGGHGDRHGHQSERSESCDCDRGGWYCGIEMMKCRFMIGAMKEDSHHGAAAV